MKAFIFTITLFLMTFQHAYAAVTTIRCDYDTFASIQKVEQTNEIMQLVFTVDTKTSEVQVVRKTGVKDVDLYPTGGGFTFIEVNERGNVLTTTVDIHGKTAHSRNTI